MAYGDVTLLFRPSGNPSPTHLPKYTPQSYFNNNNSFVLRGASVVAHIKRDIIRVWVRMANRCAGACLLNQVMCKQEQDEWERHEKRHKQDKDKTQTMDTKQKGRTQVAAGFVSSHHTTEQHRLCRCGTFDQTAISPIAFNRQFVCNYVSSCGVVQRTNRSQVFFQTQERARSQTVHVVSGTGNHAGQLRRKLIRPREQVQPFFDSQCLQCLQLNLRFWNGK